MATKTAPAQETKEDAPKEDVLTVVKDENDKSDNKKLTWNGVRINLPAELPAAWMFDVFEAQSGADDTVMIRAIYELVGPDQWRKCRDAAKEKNLQQDAFHQFIQKVLQQYGMAEGESPASTDS